MRYLKQVLPWLLAALLGAGWLASATAQEPQQEPLPKRYESFHMKDLAAERIKADQAYLPFLRVATLSCGFYVIPKGGVDGQTPHALDEVYYIYKGRARLVVDGNTIPVAPGSVVYVQSGAVHQFTEVTEDLEVLVFFSSASPYPEK